MNILENILEKILEEIARKEDGYCQGGHSRTFCLGACIMAADVKGIIRKHMNHHSGAAAKMVGWIPVEERLPEKGQTVLATVNHSEWISDHGSKFVPQEEWHYHPESSNIYMAEYTREGNWRYSDEYNEWVYCDEKEGSDPGVVYDTVTAWQPLPKPYKGE